MIRPLGICVIGLLACQKPSAPATTPALDLTSIQRQARLAYRASAGGFEASHDHWRAATSRDGALKFAPASKASGPIELRTAGEAFEALVQRDGSLSIARQDAVETLRNTEAGVEQSWTFSQAPAGSADLEVRVRVAGHDFRASTKTGLHFRHPATGASVAYGVATWIDADGRRSRVVPVFAGGEIVLRVPRAVVDASRFPATLDPLISPEVDVDVPQPAEGAPEVQVATARLGSGHVVVWSQQSFGGFGVYAVRIEADGTLANQSGALLASGGGLLQNVAVACSASGCLVTFADAPQGPAARMFAVQLDSAGAPLGAPFLLPTSNTLPLGLVETFDGSAFVLAWADVTYAFSNIYGQTSVSRIFTLRVGADGTVLTPEATLVATNEFGGDPSLAIASNGAGTLVSWPRFTSPWGPSSAAETWAARLGPTGEVVDPGGFLAVANLSSFDHQTPMAAASDGAGYLLLTFDSDYPSSTLLATPIPAEGPPVAGVMQILASLPQGLVGATLTFDSGQYVATWPATDPVSVIMNTMVAALDPAGRPSAPQPIPELSSRFVTQRQVSGGAGLLLAWTEQVAGRLALYASRLSLTPSLPDLPRPSLAISSPAQNQPVIASDGTNYLVAWTQEARWLEPTLFATVVNASGKLVHPSPYAVTIYGAPFPLQAGDPLQVAWDGHAYLLSWMEGTNPQRVRGLHFGADGLPLELASVDVVPPPEYVCQFGSCNYAQQYSPSLACAAQGCLIAWDENLSVRTGPTGQGAPGPSTTHETSTFGGMPVALATDGSSYLASWTFLQGPTVDTAALKAVPLDATGQPTAAAIQLGASYYQAPAVAGGSAGFLVVWQQPAGTAGARVVATRISSAGAVLDAAPIAVSSATPWGQQPSVVWDGGRWLVSWPEGTDTATEVDLMAAYVGADGQPQAPFALSAESADESTAALASDGQGRILAGYKRFVAGQPRAANTVRVRLIGEPPLASSCAADSDCASGHCSDGICCATACDGQCSSCAVQGHEGTCWPVVGQPVGGRAACNSAGAVCGGICDGTVMFSCAYPPGGTSCGTPVCAEGTASGAAVCDGNGGCSPSGTQTCAPYVCGETACRTSCAADADCVDTAVCGSGACVRDTVAPVVTISALPPYTANAVATVLVGATDNRQLDRVALFNNSVRIPGSTGSVDVALASGFNQIRALAFDRAGNSAEAFASTFLDARAPRLAFTDPPAGQAIGGRDFVVTVHLEDETPTTLSVGASSTMTGGGDVQLLAQVAADGDQTISAVATDSAGNTSTASLQVLVDSVPPQVRIDLPDATQLGPQPLDQIMVWTVERSLSGADCTWSTGATFSTPRGGADVAVWLPLREGANTLTVTCRNEVGRVATDTRVVLYDTGAPSGAIASPADGAWTRDTVELSASASDDLTGVRAVRFAIDGGAPIAATLAGGFWSALFDTSTLSSGGHLLVATLEDGVGNSSTVQRTFAVDNVAPRVTLDPLSPWVRGVITVAASAADDESGVASIDLEVAGSVVAHCQAPRCVASVDTTGLRDGSFAVVATARDTAGNDAVPAQATSFADNSAPTHFIVSPLEGEIVTDPILQVSVDVVDPSFAQVTCSVEDIALGTSVDPAFQTGVNLHGFLDGRITTTCTASDRAGNSSTEHATVTLRRWTETFSASSLKLNSASGTTSLIVEGPDVGMLIPIQPRALALRVPCGNLVPALDVSVSSRLGDANRNGIPDLTLKFDKAALISALRSGVDAGVIDVSQPVPIQLLSGTRVLGTSQLQVSR